MKHNNNADFKTTTTFNKLAAAFTMGCRFIVNEGGTRSSKTWSTLQLLYLIALWSPLPLIISVVSETMPHLKRGCIRDFEKMLKDTGNWIEDNWNRTDFIYKVNNSIIEFFSADSYMKVHGPARDYLYLNEGINVQYETFRQLAMRTSKQIIIDFNPLYEFWAHSKIMVRDNAITVKSTYKDNEMLSPAIIADIEAERERDPEWWSVYGLGKVGNVQGLIMRNWDVIDKMPTSFILEAIGIDFGFTAPTAIVHVGLSNDVLYLNQIGYAPNLENTEIAEIIKKSGLSHLPVIADSAEPKSIAEIKRLGIKIHPAEKGHDSIRIGLQILNRYKKKITKGSIDIIDNFRKYRYGVDREGNYTGIPIPKDDHAIDAARYVALRYFGHIMPGNGLAITIGDEEQIF